MAMVLSSTVRAAVATQFQYDEIEFEMSDIERLVVE